MSTFVKVTFLCVLSFAAGAWAASARNSKPAPPAAEHLITVEVRADMTREAEVHLGAPNPSRKDTYRFKDEQRAKKAYSAASDILFKAQLD